MPFWSRRHLLLLELRLVLLVLALAFLSFAAPGEVAGALLVLLAGVRRS
jgi:hypothetical protein